MDMVSIIYGEIMVTKASLMGGIGDPVGVPTASRLYCRPQNLCLYVMV